MSSQHKKPIMAFVVLAVIAAALIGNQFRADAERGHVIAAGPISATAEVIRGSIHRYSSGAVSPVDESARSDDVAAGSARKPSQGPRHQQSHHWLPGASVLVDSAQPKGEPATDPSTSATVDPTPEPDSQPRVRQDRAASGTSNGTAARHSEKSGPSVVKLPAGKSLGLVRKVVHRVTDHGRHPGRGHVGRGQRWFRDARFARSSTTGAHAGHGQRWFRDARFARSSTTALTR